ncbi:hypothetical protein NHP164001_09740 [Helicobacter trogontum]|uniref:Uncharacterized protein n=1 Tax=Helicobacter trogontum TaxID=50960 RepID=A0ABQ0D3Q1_9HELI
MLKKLSVLLNIFSFKYVKFSVSRASIPLEPRNPREYLGYKIKQNITEKTSENGKNIRHFCSLLKYFISHKIAHKKTSSTKGTAKYPLESNRALKNPKIPQ